MVRRLCMGATCHLFGAYSLLDGAALSSFRDFEYCIWICKYCCIVQYSRIETLYVQLLESATSCRYESGH